MYTTKKLKQEARQALKTGVDTIADIVKVSLGAEGRNVIIPTPDQSNYIITKDGVSIAKSINPENTYEAIGANLIKEAAHRTNFEAGDGTTTATVLAQSIFHKGLNLINKDLSPISIKKGMEDATKAVVRELNSLSKKVDKRSLKKVATISANGDEVLGDLISKAFNKIGKHGKVITEKSDTLESYVDLKDGVVLERGWTHSAFKTDSIKDVCVLEDTFILIHKGKIEKGDTIVDLFEQVFNDPKGKLLILTDDIDPFVHSVIVQNVTKKAIHNKICVVKLPQILKIHKHLLSDIAVLTGANIIADELGTKISAENLGRINKCIVTEKETLIVGDNANIKSLITEIEEKINITKNKFEREELQERLARISGGVATLYVGAGSDTTLKETVDRVEDSINATRAALEEGIVPGGGIALCNAATSVKSSFLRGTREAYDEGFNAVLEACKTPALQICENADIPPITDEKGFGVDVKTRQGVDMIKAGIIDPTKVVRCALENATSVASLFLTTEAVVGLKK